MTNKERSTLSKWNAHYAFSKSEKHEPALVLQQAGDYLPASGDVLDLACGRGTNALFLAHKGLRVHAWDISDNAISLLETNVKSENVSSYVTTEVRDVIANPPPEAHFDMVLVVRFLHRPLCKQIEQALKPGGVLFYQTFTAGLSNPGYMLKKGELASLFPALETCLFVEQPVDEHGRAESMFVGRKPS